MTQLTRHPAYLVIEDKLDAIGQKYRVFQMARGLILWTPCAAGSCVAAALLSHWAGPGKLAWTIFVTWGLWIVLSGFWWLLKPMLLKPRAVQVARLVEQRVEGLHNGLTNSVLLAKANDLQESPWLGPIFDEILSTTRTKPLGRAVTMRDLQLIAMIALAVVVFLGGILMVPAVRQRFQHGWTQLFQPSKEMPYEGTVTDIKCEPESATVIVGHPLEIRVTAHDPRNLLPACQIVFDKANCRMDQPAAIQPQSVENGKLSYTCRIEHVEEPPDLNQPIRWRVKIEDSTSQWCEIKVVKQVKLREVVLTVTPPLYTHKDAKVIALKPEEIGKKPLAVLEGSKVNMSVAVDIPVRNAMLQLNDDGTAPMQPAEQNKRFTGSAVVMNNCQLSGAAGRGRTGHRQTSRPTSGNRLHQGRRAEHRHEVADAGSGGVAQVRTEGAGAGERRPGIAERAQCCAVSGPMARWNWSMRSRSAEKPRRPRLRMCWISPRRTASTGSQSRCASRRRTIAI